MMEPVFISFYRATIHPMKKKQNQAQNGEKKAPGNGKSGGGKPIESAVVTKKDLASPKFTKALAWEIVQNIFALGKLPTTAFHKREKINKATGTQKPEGENLMLVDTSVLIDGRIVPVVNSGFLTGTLVIPRFILGEVQHIADSADSLRRAKGRRGLDAATRLTGQKANPFTKTMIVSDEVPEVKEIDHKLVSLAKAWGASLLTVDFNLAQVARTQGVRVLNLGDLTQALKVALMPGEEVTIKITHTGKERAQGVGYLSDGTMVVVEDTRDRVGQDVVAIVTKIHQTAAGQLFFCRLK